MPVDFDGSADYIKFADNAIYDDLTTKSVFLRTTLEGDGTGNAPRLLWKTPPNPSEAGWSVLYNTGTDKFGVVHTTSGNPGSWTTTTTFTSGTLSFGFSHDISNINNDPNVYINAVDETTETGTPTGAFDADAGDGLFVGMDNGTAVPSQIYEGKIWDIHIANVIWTPAEFASLHASKAPGLWMRGLIFYAPMNGAAGLQTFGGAALGGANTVTDIISGIIGTAASSPLGVADTTLAF